MLAVTCGPSLERQLPANGQGGVGFELVAVEVLPHRQTNVGAEALVLEDPGRHVQVDADDRIQSLAAVVVAKRAGGRLRLRCAHHGHRPVQRRF